MPRSGAADEEGTTLHDRRTGALTNLCNCFVVSPKRQDTETPSRIVKIFSRATEQLQQYIGFHLLDSVTSRESCLDDLRVAIEREEHFGNSQQLMRPTCGSSVIIDIDRIDAHIVLASQGPGKEGRWKRSLNLDYC